MHVKLSLIAVFVCMLLLAAAGCNPGDSSAGSKASPSPSKELTPAKEITLASEWAEVRQKYPKLALEHLKLKEAVSEGVLFAVKADEKAYKASDFHRMVSILCVDNAGRWVACAQTPTVDNPGTKCPRCNVCKVGGLDVDCSNCLQGKADAGCF
jgi:hypothetical protein